MGAAIGLIDVDGHRFPNLALMRIAAFHKKNGDAVDWWNGFDRYNTVYASKIFSRDYSGDFFTPTNADQIITGGTGFAITKNGKYETYNAANDMPLPQEIEKMKPDYTIYPQFDFAVAMTSRGCPRNCPFCHVTQKEGNTARKVANVDDFFSGQRHIEVLDPNITACTDKAELFEQYIETRATVTFNQGLDIRLIDNKDIELLNKMRIKYLHFAWDNPREDLEPFFNEFAKGFKRKKSIAVVFVLTNFNSTMAEDLSRIYKLRDIGFDPYVMVYDKPNAKRIYTDLQRWCNNKMVFRYYKRFEDYTVTRGI